MKRSAGRAWALALAAILLLCSFSAGAEVERNGLLDSAFSLLEEGNIFVERYNQITGAEVTPLFKYGMCYLFSGKTFAEITHDYPDYSITTAKETTKNYRKGSRYINGFDCSGFTQWVLSENDLPAHPLLGHMIINYNEYRQNYVYSNNSHIQKNMPMLSKYEVDWVEVNRHLQVGDLLCRKILGRHVMMYIGTLRDYGFSEEELPELKDYLDYPLVIHCGPNPQYEERFTELVANDERYAGCLVTDGGVNVSLLGVHMNDAPYIGKNGVKKTGYFKLDDEHVLTVYDFNLNPREEEVVTSYCWFRLDAFLEQ